MSERTNVRSQDGQLLRSRTSSVKPLAHLPAEKAKHSAAVGNQAVLASLGIRAKLTISQPSDPEECEADRAADAFVAGAATAPIGDRAIASPPAIQRKCTSCEEEEEEQADDTGTISRKAAGPAPQMPRLPSASGLGSAIPAATRRPYEQFFGADLSRVKVHDDSSSHDAASSLRAQAFARGDDIYFARGRLDFHTNEGSRLLAHELTHVVQSTASHDRVARQPEPGVEPSSIDQAIRFITTGVQMRMPTITVPQLRSRSLLELDTIREGVHDNTNYWLEHWYVAQMRQAQLEREDRRMSAYRGSPVAIASLLMHSQDFDTSGTLEEGIRLLWRAVPLIDRLEIYDEAHREIEQAQLDVIRSSSRAERDLAMGEQTRPRLERVFSLMSAREEYDARELFDTSATGRLRNAERMLERQEEEELYDAILNLDSAPRRRFVRSDHYSEIVDMLWGWQREIVVAMVSGTEVDALIARLRLATEGRTDDQEAVTRVMDRAVELLKERRDLKTAMDQGQLSGSALTDAQARMRQLDDLDRVMTFERPGGGELAGGSFLGLVSSARDDSSRFAADARRLAAFATSPEDARRIAFETAKQRILIAGDTEDSIRMAIQQLHAAPPQMPADASPNAVYVAQLRADEEFRRELLRDPAVHAVVTKLKGSEQMRVLSDISADRYDELIWQLNEANNGGRWGELFHIAILFSRSEQWRWRYRTERQKYFTPESRVFGRPAEIVDLILASPERPPLAEILDFLSSVEQLRAVMDDIGEVNRAALRLGWYLTEHPRIGPPTEAEAQAVELYRKFHRHLKHSQEGLFGEDASGAQTVMSVALGSEPTAAELETGEGRYRAALIWYEQHEARLGLDRGASAGFTETDETMVGAGREYAALWLRVGPARTLSALDFYALASLHQRFEGRVGEFEAASNAIGELAATIGATIAGIVVVVATGGTALTLLPTIVMAAAAGGTARVVTREMFGADFYAAGSSAGGRDFLLGSIDGALAVVSGRLAAKGVELVGLSGNALTKGVTRLAGEVAEEATQTLGRRVAAGSVEAAIDGAISGSVTEAFGALTDDRTWRHGLSAGLARVGSAALLGGLTGMVTGGVVGGVMPVLGTVGRRAWEGVVGQTADTALTRAGMGDALAAARAAAERGEIAEANRLAAQLEAHLDPHQVLALHGDINARLQRRLGKPAGLGDVTTEQQRVLDATRHIDEGLSDTQRGVETDIVRRSEPQPSTMAGYVDEVNLGNGHTWRRRPDGTWCRFTKRTLCGTTIPNVKLPPGTEAETALARARLEEATTRADVLQEWMGNPQLLMQRLRLQGKPPYAFTPAEEDVILKLFPHLDPEEVTIAELNRALSPPTRSRAVDPTGSGGIVRDQRLAGPSRAQSVLADIESVVAQRADDLRILSTPLYKQMRELSPGPIGADIRRRARGIDQLSRQPAPSGRLAADHIVPLSDIVRMPNFAALAERNIDEATRICNLRQNLHAIDFNVNSARGNRSWADDFTGRDTYSRPALDDIMRKENELRVEIQKEINDALTNGRRGR